MQAAIYRLVGSTTTCAQDANTQVPAKAMPGDPPWLDRGSAKAGGTLIPSKAIEDKRPEVQKNLSPMVPAWMGCGPSSSEYTTIATNASSELKHAKHCKFEALQEQCAAELAKKLKGRVRFLGTESEPIKVVSDEFKKSARRHVN